MRRKLLLNLGSALALVAALAAGLWGFFNFDPRPTIHLRDGSRVSLQGVWRNRADPIVMGPPWMQRLSGFLTPGMRDRLGWRSSYPWLGGKGLGVSLMLRSSSPWELEAMLEDRHGCRFYPTQSWCDPFGTDHLLAEHVFTLAPREEQYRVRLCDAPTPAGFAGIPLAAVSSPIQGPVSAWVADPLPARREDDGWSAVLRSVETEARIPQASALGRPVERPGLVLRMELEGEWRPFAAVVSDPSGASIRTRCSFDGQSPYRVSVPVSLCRTRTYKVRIEFSRVLTPNSRPDSFVRKSVSVVPTRVTMSPMPIGMQIVVVGMSGGAYGHLTKSWRGWRYRVHSRLPRSQIAVADHIDSSGSQDFHLKLPEGTQNADLVVEGFRSRFLEWTVQPDWR